MRLSSVILFIRLFYLHSLLNPESVNIDSAANASPRRWLAAIAPALLLGVAVLAQLNGKGIASRLGGRMAPSTGATTVTERKLVVTLLVGDRTWNVHIPRDLQTTTNKLLATGTSRSSDKLLAELRNTLWYDPGKSVKKLYGVKLKPRPPQPKGLGQPTPPIETHVVPDEINIWLYQVEFERQTHQVTSSVVAHSRG